MSAGQKKEPQRLSLSPFNMKKALSKTVEKQTEMEAESKQPRASSARTFLP